MRYLTPSQVWSRGQRLARRRVWRIQGRTAPHSVRPQFNKHQPLYAGISAMSEFGPWQAQHEDACARAAAVARLEFCFLNQRVLLHEPVDWHAAELSQLWRYHLHYFGYVQDLLVWSAAGQTEAAYETFRTLSLSWIAGNRAISGDGWHPYTLSLRAVNWLHAIAGFAPQLVADETFRAELLSSLYGQAQVLALSLELDVRGNHLLENLRALIWLGVAFEGGEAQGWLQRALKLLRREVDEQILPDGGHFERSPGYHLVVLKDLLEIAIWLQRNKRVVPTWLDQALRRMFDYLLAILPSTARIPLLKDTAWDAAPDPLDLLAAGVLYFNDQRYKTTETFGLYPFLLFGQTGFDTWQQLIPASKLRSSEALSDTGHYVLQSADGGEHMVVDAGKPCPDYLPAHAHADLLSYELIVDAQPVVVDSGVYEYTRGPWRDYFRSTRAHNTVEVAGQNQSEVWSSFRVARRAKVGNVTWKQGASWALVQAEHDGYQRLNPAIRHRRTIVWREKRFWLVIDELFGTGTTNATSYIHLHPRLAFEPIADDRWHIQGVPTPLSLTAFGQQDSQVVHGQRVPMLQGWYSEQFGELMPNSVLALRLQTDLPACFGYLIARQPIDTIDCRPTSDGQEITIASGERQDVLLVPRSTPPRYGETQ